VAVLVDPSAILAAADAADLNHAAAVAWFERVDEPLLLCALGLAELDLVVQRELGPAAMQAVVASIVSGSIRLVPPTPEDVARSSALLAEAAEHRPMLADALLVAAAERLGIRRVAAFDRRPLAVFRPRHLRGFDFEP
jgi:predicted nucleic acid-binding protein